MSPLSNSPLVYVDDDEDDQLLFRQAIQELGFPNPVRVFSNGLDALRYLETTPEIPLLVLSDLHMPIMGGMELRDRMAASDFLRAKSIPFVLVTTSASPEDIRQVYASTSQGVHTKAEAFGALKAQLGLIVSYWQSCLHPNRF